MSEKVLVDRDTLETLLNATHFSFFQNVGGGTAITIASHKYAGFRAAEKALQDALSSQTEAAQVEIINPQGRIAYRRPLSHPDVLEALRRPGYSVRKSE